MAFRLDRFKNKKVHSGKCMDALALKEFIILVN